MYFSDLFPYQVSLGVLYDPLNNTRIEGHLGIILELVFSISIVFLEGEEF